MIQLQKFKGENLKWDGRFVWVNPDHITFLSFTQEQFSHLGKSIYKPFTTITCIGGGQVNVMETPELILTMVPAKL